MEAWFYFRGRLIEVEGEHIGPIAKIARGYARIRYHEDSEILAVQARSKNIVCKAINLFLDEYGIPSRINAHWPGKFVDCPIQDWK